MVDAIFYGSLVADGHHVISLVGSTIDLNHISTCAHTLTETDAKPCVFDHLHFYDSMSVVLGIDLDIDREISIHSLGLSCEIGGSEESADEAGRRLVFHCNCGSSMFDTITIYYY